MFRKKLKFKQIKVKQLKRDRRVVRAFLVVLVVVGVGVGLLIAVLQPPEQHPRNLVWAADKTVKIPSDLMEFLRTRDDCRGYRGTNSPTGVGLWAVYQVSHERFAKIAYGCSLNLDLYIVAVKEKNRWVLIPPTDYFAGGDADKLDTSFLPKCTWVDKYQLDKSFESFCIEADGSARTNEIKR